MSHNHALLRLRAHRVEGCSVHAQSGVQGCDSSSPFYGRFLLLGKKSTAGECACNKCHAHEAEQQILMDALCKRLENYNTDFVEMFDKLNSGNAYLHRLLSTLSKTFKMQPRSSRLNDPYLLPRNWLATKERGSVHGHSCQNNNQTEMATLRKCGSSQLHKSTPMFIFNLAPHSSVDLDPGNAL